MVVLVALVVPPLLVVNAFRALAHDWFVEFEYGRDGFPSDSYGLTREQRTELALVGLRSIQPGSEGVALLRRAALPDGSPAFGTREVAHMDDVRQLLGAALRAQLVAVLALAVVATVAARSRALRTAVPRGLLAGSLAMLGLAALAVPVILVGFDGFFLRFHELFFEGNTWRFARTDTLLRLYPERFWRHTAELGAAIVVGQAVALAGLSRWWLRRAGRPGASR